MRALSRRLNEDTELWGLAGLVHDLDLDECMDDPERHAVVGAQVLKERGASDLVVQAVLGHNNKAERTTLMAKALWVVDPTTGFITASALILPSKSTRDLKVSSIKKRMKDKRFAAAVSRDQIGACKEQLGLDLDEFLQICLSAIDEIRDRVGLGGATE
jgi:predicted hydrolase (HD superfamily)